MWIITRRGSATFIVEDGKVLKATIVQKDEREWAVAFLNVKKLNREFRNVDLATGYVRGVEACSNLIGNELKGIA